MKLGVVEISMFHRLVNELEAAFNAALVLVGECGNAIRDGVVLHADPG